MRNYTGRQEPLPTYPASNCFILRNVGVWLRHHAQAKLYVAGTMHLPCALKVYFRTEFQSEKVCNLDLSLPSHLTLPLQVDISQVVIKNKVCDLDPSLASQTASAGGHQPGGDQAHAGAAQELAKPGVCVYGLPAYALLSRLQLCICH